MNYSLIRKILGKIMILIAMLMILPLTVSLIYQESIKNVLSFLIPMILMGLFGYLLNIKKVENLKIYAREGLITVGLSWVLIALFGSLPFILSGEIPNFIDAFFETASGFTTTGASILTDVESLSHSILFWRSFTHWIGGMGVLVFILAIIPESKDGSTLYLMKAESTGPQVGKLVSKMQVTSRILYLMYIVLTVIEFLLLALGPDKRMGVFESLIYTFGTAGTGGFGMHADSVASFTPYTQYVISGFMIIFGINFSLFYLLLLGNIKEVFKNEELRLYLFILIVSILVISINIYSICDTIEQAFRLSLFQVASIISTTGYATTDFAQWPALSQGIILIIMMTGACAGSTAGGFKLSRVNVLLKSSASKIKNAISPRKVDTIRFEGKVMDENTISNVQAYLAIYLLLIILGAFLISIDGTHGLLENITASITMINNVGPGLGVIGPAGSFANYSYFSKIILSIFMIAGRLELIPILVLFNPNTWKRKK